MRGIPIVIGYSLATMVRWLLNTSFVFALGLLMGMDVLGGPADLAALLALGLTVNVIGTLWAAGVALRLRSTQAGPDWGSHKRIFFRLSLPAFASNGPMKMIASRNLFTLRLYASSSGRICTNPSSMKPARNT